MPFPKAIITKPFLISDSEYKDLGLNINLVGYDSFSQIAENTKQHVSPRLLNWVEPYEISGERKSLFYTEVNTNFQVGDKVYILNGNYDNDSLIKKDKYKKGRDGYKVLKMDQCKVVLDIDYTGVLPYNNDSFDDYIKIYYINDSEKFLSANRQVTTRGGKFDYKFNYYQNNIAFIDKNLKGIDGWGLNAGVSGTPGFFVREERQGWSKISDELVYLGSFSVALSPTYSNNGKIVIMDGSFEYNGIQFKEGFVYRWEVGPTSSAWQVDQECSPAIITKSNFRNGTFNGKFNNGLYGTQKNKLDWNGKGTWNGGTMVNTRWKSGTIDSKLNFVSTYKAVFDEYGIPFQKSYTNNNGGFGFNYIFDSEIEKSLVNNGNFYNTSFEQAATFSVVENHVLSITQSFDNKIVKANFELCNFKNIQIEGGELKNTRSFNSKISNVKSINSYFEKSVLKDSTYVSDEIIKILGYDEWNMSEYFSPFSGSFSSIKDVNNKIYKFYISKENFKRLKSEDVFYIKGLKINNSPTLTNFFDNKFRLTSWTEFYDDYSTGSKSITGVDPYSFYKRGYECSAFLSTPEENAYVINSYEGLYNVSGATVSKYTSVLSGTNSKAAYSIDILVSRHDLLNKNQSMDSTSEWDSLNPKNYNYDSDVIVGTTSLPAYLGNNIDISTAYILDSDFDSGIIETSDWNSGHHINYNNDVVITSVTSSGIYNLEIDNYNDYLIAYTNINYKNTENNNIISEGDVLFLNSIDYDTRGMVTNVTIIATGSSYSSSSDPIFLVNTKVESLTMSNVGTYYKKDTGLITYNKTGKGTGLTIDVDAKEIGAVLGITYSAPMSGGGSYSMNFNSSVSTSTGPISTSTFVFNILTDDSLGTVTGITPAQNNGNNATYSVFGPPLTVSASGATGVGAIFVTGPLTTSPTGATSCVSLGSGLTLNYKTSANGAITYLEINNPGSGYEVGQIFKVEGGGATFSIKSVSKGEIISYKINNPGEDYLKGDILEIIKPFDPNFQFGTVITASVVVTSITVSNSDTKGLSLDILAVTGSGYISNISINGPGLYYTEGDIFTIDGGNLDALVRIDSVTGSVIRLNDTYKVLENDKGKIILKDLGVQNIIAGLTARGIFYTTDAKNRWGYLSKTKIDKTKIKSGIFKRSYITNSLIRDINYDSTDRNFNNLTKIKNLVISDSLFSNNSNILSSATYLYSNIVGGTDIWNDGIINKSVINGLTFSKGTIKQSTWIDGNFTGGMFFFSKSFDAKPTEDRPNYLSDRVRSYYMTGELGATLSNNRYSWRNGKLSGGQFYKSDWENGVMNNGLFFYSKFYNGTINGGKIGTKEVSSTDTRVYNGLINYTTVDNAHVYSEDTSYTGLSSSNIVWMNGIFNKGVFGSNNDDILGTTFSYLSYAATFSTSMPIADFKITIASQSVTDVNPILGDFEIDVRTTIKHTYLGDLIINLMSPNGKIINLKKRYSCGSNDNLLSTVFSSDSTKPNIEIGTTPYTGTFKFDALLNQGVYYDLNNNLLPNIQYREEGAIIPEVLDYKNRPPAVVYEGDRYLVVATASDPSWTPTLAAPSSNPWWNFPVGSIVEKSTNPAQPWELYYPKNNDKLFVKNKSEYLKYIDSKWTKSYHSNTTKILDLLNTDKTVTGNWKMMIMDCAAVDSGFVEAFEITFSYKTSYIIKSFKNDAVWNNGIFNGGQFIDLGVWKNGTFNGGKFISTFGYEKSGSYLVPSKNELEYSWQNGIFNGGEFGNESLLSNSTWYNGEFNDGVFKGKLWNNGVFTYGEFKGGSSVPAIGNGIKSANAQIFMESFKNEYYGVWLGGVVSDKKDNFVTDKKLFTKPLRAMTPVKLGKTAKFTNMLWASGTFNHPSGEIKNSIWLNGLFKMGNFKSSAFNPYVTRRSDKQEFVKDDSCIWENGKLIDSEFHMSKWTYGQFISGTAVGMIWKNGISNYMNAYNIFWENGVWRNGNWYGSNFEYRGKVEDGFAKEILNRGIEWSGTSSCHIWNLFESDVDTTSSIATTSILNAAGDSFTTTNLDDAGYSIPSINNLIITKIDATSVKAEFTIVANGGAPIKEVGFIYTTNTTSVAAANSTPNISVSNQIGTGFSGTTVKATVATPPTYTFTTGVSTTGIPTGLFGQVIITGLLSNLFYTIRGYAINLESNTGGAALTPNMIVFQTVQPNTVTFNSNLMPITTPNLVTGEVYSGAGNIWQQGVKKSITIPASYNSYDVSKPAPTGPNSKGIVYIVQNIGVLAPTNLPTVDNGTVIYSTGTGTAYTTTIPTTGVNAVVANKVYYIRAFTINASGPGYSDLITITSGVDLPTLGTTTVTTDLTGNLSNTGGSTTIQRGFIISSTNTALTTKPSTIAETSLSGGSGMVRINIDTNATLTSFTKTINTISAGLTPAIQYYVRAYVYNTTYDYDNCNAFAYSNILPFTSAATAPGITTNSVVSSIISTGATLTGTVVSLNGAIISETGFIYTTTSESVYPTDPLSITTNTVTLGKVTSSDFIGPFTENVTGLSEGQKYYFKAYAKSNIGGTSYGVEKSFMTLPLVSPLVYNLGGSTDNTYSTKTTNVGIIPKFTVTSAQAIVSKGIIWSANNTTNWWLTAPARTTDTAATTTLTTGTVGVNVSLVSNKKYFVVGYATNTDSNTYYTAPIEVYTKPTFITSTVVTATSINSDGFIINVNNSTGVVIEGASGNSVNITARGVLWGTPASWAVDSWTNAPSAGASSLAAYSITIGGSSAPLASGTEYWYRPFVANLGPGADNVGYYLGSGLISGDHLSVTTLVKITALISTQITYASLKISIGTLLNPITVTNTGNSTTTRYGICYISNNSLPVGTPDVSSNLIETTGAVGPNFIKEITLTALPSTPIWYKVRAYVENTGGVEYSNLISFSLNSAGVLDNILINN